MAKSRKVFAVHPGGILKTEFMEPMGVSGYELAKALNFPGSTKSSAETAPLVPTRQFAWESTSAYQHSSGLTCRTTTT